VVLYHLLLQLVAVAVVGEMTKQLLQMVLMAVRAVAVVEEIVLPTQVEQEQAVKVTLVETLWSELLLELEQVVVAVEQVLLALMQMIQVVVEVVQEEQEQTPIHPGPLQQVLE
jgi:hypothetical protein